jgi:predicted signal transduction protein with EAL and GGDEF domain
LADLARKLDVVTVAEGVETEEQRRYVDRRGVSLAQGWLYAMSLPAGEFAHFLAGSRASTRSKPCPSKPPSQDLGRRWTIETGGGPQGRL